jgi:nucleotide-binding universal stress UspA family protein
MLVTSILGPILTGQFARKISSPSTSSATEITFPDLPPQSFTSAESFTIVVPIYNPHTQRYLIEMAAILARHESGNIVPLSITMASAHLDDPQFNSQFQQSQRLIERALNWSREFNIEAKPVIRIDDDIAHGISRTAREQNASLIVMGWSPTTSIQARLFGNVIDNVFWSSHCPVAVMRLLDEPMNIQRVLLPVKDVTTQALRTVRFAQLFAEINRAQVTLLHVCDHQSSRKEIAAFEQELSLQIAQLNPRIEMGIRTTRNNDIARAITRVASDYDLVILRSMRRRTVGGLAVSDVTTRLLKKITGSLILFGEPHAT